MEIKHACRGPQTLIRSLSPEFIFLIYLSNIKNFQTALKQGVSLYDEIMLSFQSVSMFLPCPLIILDRK